MRTTWISLMMAAGLCAFLPTAGAWHCERVYDTGSWEWLECRVEQQYPLAWEIYYETGKCTHERDPVACDVAYLGKFVPEDPVGGDPSPRLPHVEVWYNLPILGRGVIGPP